MTMYRRKPAVIEARQVPDPFDYDETCEVFAWVRSSGSEVAWDETRSDHSVLGWIPTLEGSMAVRAGDWVIRGVAGEFFTCKPGIFAATYEPAEAT